MVASVICTAVLLFSMMFYLRIALSFFPARSGGAMMQVRELAFSVTEPAMMPLRRALPPAQGAAAGIGIDTLVMFLILLVLQIVFC